MAPRHQNSDEQQPRETPRPHSRVDDLPDRTYPEPGDAVDRTNDADLLMDEQQREGDQDIDTAGIPDVDVESPSQPGQKRPDRGGGRK